VIDSEVAEEEAEANAEARAVAEAQRDAYFGFRRDSARKGPVGEESPFPGPAAPGEESDAEGP
jgi:hypothetical protein